jgi:hypothetical protein
VTPAGDPLLQADYGGFNPRFLGITLFYDSAVNYESVAAYLTDEDGPDVGGLHGVSLRSVLDHEMRHYVDFLLSTYSTATFRLRLQAMVNGVQAVSLVREMEGAVLPVPLTRWALSSEEQRAGFEREWSEILGRSASAIPVPSLSREQLRAPLPPGLSSIAGRSPEERFAAFAEAAVRAYASIDELTQGFGAAEDAPHLHPAYIHEVSALSAQLAAIHHGQGADEARTFAMFLLDSDLPQASVWRLALVVAGTLERLWSGDEDPLSAIRRILTVTVWAMAGDFPEDGQAACPALRFRALATGLTEDPDNRLWSGDIDDRGSLEWMWDYWDERLGLTSWRSGLTAQLAWGERALEQYTTLAEGGFKFGELALAAVELTVRDQRKLIETMLSDPRHLAVPEQYVKAPRDLIPLPDGRLEFRGFASRTAHEGMIPLNRTTKDGETYTSGVAFALGGGDPQRREELKLKLRIETMIEWCDLVFSRLSVPAHTALSARSSLQELTDKHVLQLI